MILTSRIFLLGFIALGVSNCGSNESKVESLESKVILEYPAIKTEIAIVSKVWGVSGNHESTTIKKIGGKRNDSSEVQIFYTSEVYYRVGGDTSLIIYVPESSFSTLLDKIGAVKLNVVAINNSESLNSLTSNYQSMGLSKISAYDN